MTYAEIFKMIIEPCGTYFYAGCKDVHKEVVESATKIYIKQMELEFAREKLEKENNKILGGAAQKS